MSHKKTIHEKRLDYECAHCDKRFGQAGTLRRHAKLVHKIEMEVEQTHHRRPGINSIEAAHSDEIDVEDDVEAKHRTSIISNNSSKSIIH